MFRYGRIALVLMSGERETYIGEERQISQREKEAGSLVQASSI